MTAAPAGDLISIAAAAKAIGVNKSTLARQVKAGLVRSHDGRVRLFEVIEDRAKNVDHSKAHRRSADAETRALPTVASPGASHDATPADATPVEVDATLSVDGDALISIAAAAKAIGVNKSTLSRQVQSGAIRSHGGKVRLTEVLEDRAKNIDLNKSSTGRKHGRKPVSSSDDDMQQLEMVLVDGKLLPFAAAQALKENYLAKLRQLEYLTKSGAVVDRQETETLFFKLSREGRDAWLAWAPRIAVLMAADLGVDAALLSETLARYVQQHLGDLGEPVVPESVAANGQPAGGLAPGSDPASAAHGS